MRSIVDADPTPAHRYRATVTMLATTGAMLLAATGAGASSARRTSPEGKIVVNPHLALTAANLCSWRFGTHPVPLSNRHPVQIRIDDRCNYPEDPNPKTDTPTGVYSSPHQVRANEVTTIPDGTNVTVTCYILHGGETISDAVGNTSPLWLHIRTPNGQTGDMPDINVGGGYTQQQLGSLGLAAC